MKLYKLPSGCALFGNSLIYVTVDCRNQPLAATGIQYAYVDWKEPVSSLRHDGIEANIELKTRSVPSEYEEAVRTMRTPVLVHFDYYSDAPSEWDLKFPGLESSRTCWFDHGGHIIQVGWRARRPWQRVRELLADQERLPRWKRLGELPWEALGDLEEIAMAQYSALGTPREFYEEPLMDATRILRSMAPKLEVGQLSKLGQTELCWLMGFPGPLNESVELLYQHLRQNSQDLFFKFLDSHFPEFRARFGADIRRCKYELCGKFFARPPHLREHLWKRKKYCTGGCSSKARQHRYDQQHRHTRREEVRKLRAFYKEKGVKK